MPIPSPRSSPLPVPARPCWTPAHVLHSPVLCRVFKYNELVHAPQPHCLDVAQQSKAIFASVPCVRPALTCLSQISCQCRTRLIHAACSHLLAPTSDYMCIQICLLERTLFHLYPQPVGTSRVGSIHTNTGLKVDSPSRTDPAGIRFTRIASDNAFYDSCLCARLALCPLHTARLLHCV